MTGVTPFLRESGQPMNKIDPSRIKGSLIDVSTFPTELREGALVAKNSALVDTIIDAVEKKNGFAVVYGANKVLAAHGLDIHTDAGAEVARSYLEGIFREAAP